MQLVRFLVTIRVDEKPYKAGDVVPVAEIPAGNLASMTRLQQAETFEASEKPEIINEGPSQPAPTPKKGK